MKAIQGMDPAERPREKLIEQGAQALTDCELLAILIGSGGKGHGVHRLAAKVLECIDTQNGNLKIADLKQIYGIGEAKACIIGAALEFSRRRIRPRGVRITAAGDALPLLHHWADRKQEHFLGISLNGAHEVIATRVITIGLLNASQIHPREVFCEPLKDRACALLVAHNHPSGRLDPSAEDIAATRMLWRAGKTLGIALLDHIIFSESGYFSFQESRPCDLREGL